MTKSPSLAPGARFEAKLDIITAAFIGADEDHAAKWVVCAAGLQQLRAPEIVAHTPAPCFTAESTRSFWAKTRS